MDLPHDSVRSIRHEGGKFFVPFTDVTIRDMFHYSAEYMVHPDDKEDYLRFNDPDTLLERLEASDEPGVLKHRVRYKLLGGGWRWVERILVGGTRHGLPEGVVYAFIFDVQEQVADKAAADMPRQRNELTGLLWEEEFFERGQDILMKHPEGWCLVAIDLEHFKLFNEWYGRQQGDLLLATVGAKLSRLEEETGGLACYLGQDDFCVLMPLDRDRIERLYDEIHAQIRSYGTTVGFMPAFGITPADAGNGNTVFDLYDRASLAARQAKENYHTRIRTFDPVMYEQTEKDYQILSDFQNGLEAHELFFQLQPQCQISTGRVVGAESLVRWRKANGELVPPGVFVPVLEEYGFVTDLDKYVWEEVCAWQKRWIEQGNTPLPVSVNVSQIDVFNIDVPEYFDKLIKKYKLPVDVLKIEITESAYVDNDRITDAVQRLREKGFLVLMDDFGSGYSSLNMLRNLNVDIIKLDAQFLRMRGDDRKGIQIMESIVNMAKTMGVPIIVEGVETQEESEFLAGLGCHYVQGYYFYRPMPVKEFERLIANPHHIDTRGVRFKGKEQFRIREFMDQNMFSDTMLNNILGPVAFFSLRGKEVDILRYNRQFYKEAKSPGFSRRMKSVQRVVLPEELPRLYAMFDKAVKSPLNGSSGVFTFLLPSGPVRQIFIRCFFLEQDEDGKRFYVSIRDVTSTVAMEEDLSMLSQLSPVSIVLLRGEGSETSCRVMTHGLEKALGVTKEELERELNDGRFFKRAEAGERQRLKNLVKSAGSRTEKTSLSLKLRGADAEPLDVDLLFDRVTGLSGEEENVLVLHRKRP
jgi:diguanylate cyclase (GGDEF)-like protein